MDDSLELVVMCTDGLAYFKAGEVPYVSHDHAPRLHVASSAELRPGMLEYSRESRFSEPGRRFSSVDEATQYVGAVTAMERMYLLVPMALDPDAPVELRACVRRLIAAGQRGIRSRHLGVLSSIPSFDASHLEMTPEQLYLAITGRSHEDVLAEDAA